MLRRQLRGPKGILHSRRDDAHGALAFFERSTSEQALEKAAMAELEAMDQRLHALEATRIKVEHALGEARAATLDTRAALDALTSVQVPAAGADVRKKAAAAGKKKSKLELEADAAILATATAAAVAADAAYAAARARAHDAAAERSALERAKENIERTYVLGLETRVYKFNFSAELAASRAGLRAARARVAAGEPLDGFHLASHQLLGPDRFASEREPDDVGASFRRGSVGRSSVSAGSVSASVELGAGVNVFASAAEVCTPTRALQRSVTRRPWQPAGSAQLADAYVASTPQTPHATSRRHLVTPNGQAFLALVEPNPFYAPPHGGRARARASPTTPSARRAPSDGAPAPVREQRPGEVDLWVREPSPSSSRARTPDATTGRPGSGSPGRSRTDAHVSALARPRTAGAGAPARPATASSLDEVYASGVGYEGMPRPATASSLYRATATQRVRAASHTDLRRLPFGHVDISGSLPAFNTATFGFASRKANPPPSLRHRPAWRPPTPSHSVLIADAARAGAGAAEKARAPVAAGASVLSARVDAIDAALAHEQARCREQLRVDARRKEARSVLAERGMELDALHDARAGARASFDAANAEFCAMLARLGDLDAQIAEREASAQCEPEPPAATPDPRSAKPKLKGSSLRPASDKAKAAPATADGGAAKRAPTASSKAKSSPSKEDEPASFDVTDAADQLATELAAFHILARAPAEAFSASASAAHARLAHEMDECRRELAGYSRARANGMHL